MPRAGHGGLCDRAGDEATARLSDPPARLYRSTRRGSTVSAPGLAERRDASQGALSASYDPACLEPAGIATQAYEPNSERQAPESHDTGPAVKSVCPKLFASCAPRACCRCLRAQGQAQSRGQHGSLYTLRAAQLDTAPPDGALTGDPSFWCETP